MDGETTRRRRFSLEVVGEVEEGEDGEDSLDGEGEEEEGTAATTLAHLQKSMASVFHAYNTGIR